MSVPEQFSMGNCKAHLGLISSCGAPALQFTSWSDEVMNLGTAPSAFSPCIVEQYHLIKFGLIVLAFYPAVTTSRNTVKLVENLRRASKWQTWKCMQVLYQSALILLKKGGNSLGSWEAAGLQCTHPQTAIQLVPQLPAVLWHRAGRGSELCSRVNRV